MSQSRKVTKEYPTTLDGMQEHAYNLVKKTGAYQIRTHRNGDPRCLAVTFNLFGSKQGGDLHLDDYREAMNKTAYLTSVLQLELG